MFSQRSTGKPSSWSFSVFFLVLIQLVLIPNSVLAGKYNRKLDIGMQAPVWSKLPGVDGKQHSLHDLDKKEVVVVVFTCNSCPYAVDYEDRLVAFAKEYCGEQSKVGIVAINVNKNSEEDLLPAMADRAKAKKFSFPYLFDETQQIAIDFGATRTPEFFVLNRQRKVVYMGAMDDSTDASKVTKSYVEIAVQGALAKQKIDVAETVAIGCNIRMERRRRSRRKPAATKVKASNKNIDSIKPIAIGDNAPAFSLPGIDGKTHSLDEYKDAKLLLIVFTCNHCPTAQAYEERIKKIDDEYGKRGVELVAISPNDAQAVRLDELGWTDVGDTLEDMKVRAAAAEFKFPYLFDGENQKVSRAYGAKATPHVFLFDQSRRLRYSGRIDNGEVDKPTKHDLRDAMDALLDGREVETTTTRVFGCSVKWSDKREKAEESLQKWDAMPVTLNAIDKDGIKELVANKTERYRLINLWATWCAPCMTELPYFLDMSRRYQTRSFEVITISMDSPDHKDGVLDALKTRKMATTNYLTSVTDTDEFAKVFDEKWAGPLPYTVLIAPGGTILHRVEGEIDPLKLRQAIVQHMGRTYASKR